MQRRNLPIGELRMSVIATKVEQIMFIRLNQESVPGEKSFMNSMRERKSLAAATKKAISQAQTAAAGNTIDRFI